MKLRDRVPTAGRRAGLLVATAWLVACRTAQGPAPSAVPAPAPAPSAGSPLAGTWTLVAADDLRPDGTRAPAYGPDPRGLLIVDRDGRYSLQIFRHERPRFASGDKRRGTAQEYEAAVLGTSAHIGRCELDPATRTVTFRIEHAAYPNWDGTEQRRTYTLVGDELSYQIPAAATGTANIPISVWRRVR